jgi:glycine/D-amino acid oxidase-like deaminating enzyme/nitrite reductase/ring-hydroxylating ferredoxin subunit
MNASQEQSVSVWGRSVGEPMAGALRDGAQADVVVIGAGLAGLSVAYELTRAGRDVLVLDRGPIGGGMTARTTGHLASDLDDYYHAFIDLRGEDEARQLYRAQAEAIDRVEAIAREENIACDFHRLDAYLFADPDADPEILRREIEACHRVGFADVAWAERAPVPGRDTGRCLRFPRQARFHPLKYLAGLAQAVQRRGGRVHTHTVVTSVDEEMDGVVVTTASGGTVRAAACVVATNSPINDRVVLHTKQAPYRTYALAGRVPRGSVPDALIYDTRDPYHYVRLQEADEGSHWLIVGGEDHKTGEASTMAERLARLEAWAHEHYPSLQSVEHRWSGQVYEPTDYAAYIGRNPGNLNVFVVTGDSGQGMTNAVAAGAIIADLVAGGESRYGGVHDPKRVTFGAAATYVEENLTVASNFAEHLTGGEVDSLAKIAPGGGAIVRHGLSKVAAYRDESGTLHLVSAVCTHAGCIVHWNPYERCWDCPCHGSHFGVDGTPLQGPAKAPLAKVEPF